LCPHLQDRKALKMKAVGLFKMETTYKTTQCHNLDHYNPSHMHDISKGTLGKEVSRDSSVSIATGYGLEDQGEFKSR
jgi:hypothetical protein